MTMSPLSEATSELLLKFSRLVRWSKLRQLGTSSLVKASVLMPVFGYLILLNEDLHQYLTVKYDGRLLDYLPAMWRVWLLFYGSFCIAIATLLFAAFCPRYMKLFESPQAVVAEADARYYKTEAAEEALRRNVGSEALAVTEIETPLHGSIPVDPAWATAKQNDRILAMVIDGWTWQNSRFPRLRVSIWLLYVVGFAFISIPAVFTFFQVTFVGIRRLLTL